MNVFVVGSRLFGVAALGLCVARGLHVVGVAAPELAADGRRPDRLRDAAGRRGVPWLPAGSLRAETLPAGVDLIIAAHAHDFIGRATRLKARLGAIGYHPSFLPLHRGRDAVRWAIRMGDGVTGGTVYWLSDSIDAGDVAAQRHVFIRPGDTADELWRRELFPLGLRLLDQVLGDVASGRLVRVPQDVRCATWEPAIGRPPVFRPELPQLGVIDGFEVVRRI
jgi:methionyl-tRNA formyltransferase